MPYQIIIYAPHGLSNYIHIILSCMVEPYSSEVPPPTSFGVMTVLSELIQFMAQA